MSNEIQRFIHRVGEGRHLSRMDAQRAFQIVMSGGATPAQIAALLMGLRMKGETVAEITGAAEVLRARMETVDASQPIIDVCGTGGDGTGTLNVSTAVAFVVAGCGVAVAKHGNKSVSSRSGSADVFAELGVNIQADKASAARALAEANICFLFAPLYHKAMRLVSPVRQELAMRTIFNLLGPLANPARPQRQLMGVYDRSLLRPLARVLQGLGSESAWVVHGSDGTDELTITGVSYVAQLRHGELREFEVSPQDAGLEVADAEALRGSSPQNNARELSLLLSGKKSPYRDMVLLNAAAALVVAGRAQNVRQGAQLAAEAVDNGRAREALAQLVTITNENVNHG